MNIAKCNVRAYELLVYEIPILETKIVLPNVIWRKDLFFCNNCQEIYIVVSRYTMISIISTRRNILYNVIDCLDSYTVSTLLAFVRRVWFLLSKEQIALLRIRVSVSYLKINLAISFKIRIFEMKANFVHPFNHITL